MQLEFSEEGGISRDEIEHRRAHQQRLTLENSEAPNRSDCSQIRGRERRLNLLVLGSGSKGNASVVLDKATGSGILIDAGICKRDVFGFSEEGGFDLANLQAIIITHSHSDHTKNIGVITRGLKKAGVDVPIYAHRTTLEFSRDLQQVSDSCNFIFFEEFDEIPFDQLRVKVLPTSHDSEVSFGFRIEAGQDAIGFVTDTGIMPPETLEALRGVRILALESNHDRDLLKLGPYPPDLQARVSSDHGHLNNDQAAQILESLIDDNLETVIAMHISENNNTYRLPVETLREVVSKSGKDIQVTCAYQKRPVYICV